MQCSWGSVFKLDPNGKETVLHTFTGGRAAEPPSRTYVGFSRHLVWYCQQLRRLRERRCFQAYALGFPNHCVTSFICCGYEERFQSMPSYIVDVDKSRLIDRSMSEMA